MFMGAFLEFLANILNFEHCTMKLDDYQEVKKEEFLTSQF